MKGFIITLDSATAITFLFFAALIISTQNLDPHSPNGIYLKSLSIDSLTVLQKSGMADLALSGNSTCLPQIVEATPKFVCMNITMFNVTGDQVISYVKNGCNDTTDQDIQTTSMMILFNNSNYVARSVSWLSKVSS